MLKSALKPLACGIDAPENRLSLSIFRAHLSHRSGSTDRKPTAAGLIPNETWVIGRFLTPGERRSFKQALTERSVVRDPNVCTKNDAGVMVFYDCLC